MRASRLALAALTIAAVLGACRRTPPALELAGGRRVEGQVVALGQRVYELNCAACHGVHGDGNGPAAATMRPAPRAFGAALFKFGGVEVGQLPHDEDLEDLLRRGLKGTPMLPWDLTASERHAVVQYLKTFSPRWQQEEPGERIVPTPDPWVGREAEAKALGARIYHLSGVEKDAQGRVRTLLAGCVSCHPSYLPPAEIAALAAQTGARGNTNLAALRPALKPSEYTTPGGYALKILPPDFLFHTLKNGDTPEALYRTIAAGIAGAAMPTWKNVLSEEALWALVHYVHGLVELRGTAEGLRVRETLLAAAPIPPAPAAGDTPRERRHRSHRRAHGAGHEAATATP